MRGLALKEMQKQKCLVKRPDLGGRMHEPLASLAMDGNSGLPFLCLVPIDFSFLEEKIIMQI